MKLGGHLTLTRTDRTTGDPNMLNRYLTACDEWGILAPVALALTITAIVAIVGKLVEVLA